MIIKQLTGLHRLYTSLHQEHPDMLIIDKGYFHYLKEEVEQNGLPDFLEDISITVVPRAGKTEARFYKRLNMLKLVDSTKGPADNKYKNYDHGGDKQFIEEGKL